MHERDATVQHTDGNLSPCCETCSAATNPHTRGDSPDFARMFETRWYGGTTVRQKHSSCSWLTIASHPRESDKKCPATARCGCAVYLCINLKSRTAVPPYHHPSHRSANSLPPLPSLRENSLPALDVHTRCCPYFQPRLCLMRARLPAARLRAWSSRERRSIFVDDLSCRTAASFMPTRAASGSLSTSNCRKTRSTAL